MKRFLVSLLVLFVCCTGLFSQEVLLKKRVSQKGDHTKFNELQLIKENEYYSVKLTLEGFSLYIVVIENYSDKEEAIKRAQYYLEGLSTINNIDSSEAKIFTETYDITVSKDFYTVEYDIINGQIVETITANYYLAYLSDLYN